MKILILAGGSGKRLWPLTDPPKQFRSFGDPYSLLQKTLLRFLKRFPPSDLFVLTGTAHQEIAKLQCRAIHPSLEQQVILELAPKNTATAIAYALNVLENQLGERFLVAPSDHFLFPEKLFLDRLAFANTQLKCGFHGLFGITPTFPSAEYGYIGRKSCDLLTGVSSFYEKPSEKEALRLIQKGYLWNSGMVLFHTETLRKQLPKKIPEISIDCFLLERANNLFVTDLDLAWSDLGTWEGIYATLPKDPSGNVILGNTQLDRVKNSLIIGDLPYLADLENQVVVLSKVGKKVVVPLVSRGALFN